MSNKTQQSGDWTFEVKDNSVVITKYTGSSASVQVPEQLQGMPVIEIGVKAFADNAKIKSVIIPGCVNKIGDGAFNRCKLTAVTIGQGVKTIGSSAFDANALTSLVIPEGMTSIGVTAFRSNLQLTSVSLPKSITAIEKEAFRYCKNLTALNLPQDSKLKTIGAYAFEECKLKELTLPGSLQKIGQGAFAKNGLVRLTLNKGLGSIGPAAFKNNSISGDMAIPESVKEIDYEAFKENQITGVCIKGKTKVKGSVFSRNQISRLVLGKQVDLASASGAFVWNNLTEVTIPDGVKYKEDAFAKEVKIFIGDTGGMSFGAPATDAAQQAAAQTTADAPNGAKQAARFDTTYPTFHNEKGQYIGGLADTHSSTGTALFNTTFHVGKIRICPKGTFIINRGRDEKFPPETVGLVTPDGNIYQGKGIGDIADYDSGAIIPKYKKAAEENFAGRVVVEGDVGGVYNKDGVRVGEVRDAADWIIPYGGAMLVLIINHDPKNAPFDTQNYKDGRYGYKVPMTADEYEQTKAGKKAALAPDAAEKKKGKSPLGGILGKLLK